MHGVEMYNKTKFYFEKEYSTFSEKKDKEYLRRQYVMLTEKKKKKDQA